MSGRPALWSSAVAIWGQSMRAEWRSRYSLGASLVFPVATLAVLSYAGGPEARRPEWAGLFLWVLLLFSATASLSHGFAREVEAGTWDLLRQATGPGEILLGKWLTAASVLVVVEAVTLVGGAILLGPRVGHPAGFAAVLVLGTSALAVTLPLVSALLAQARTHGGLAATLAFPLVMPGLFAAVSGTRRALEGEWPAPELRILFAFTGVLAIAGWRLFEFVWDE